MDDFNLQSHGLLVAMLLLATVIDLRSHRIPNWLSLGGFVAGLALAIGGIGEVGVKAALVGASVGFGMLLPLYVRGAMGAGDVKLMTAVGAFLGGPALALGAVAGTFMAGGLLGLGYMMARRGAAATVQRYSNDLKIGALGGGWKGLMKPDAKAAPLRFPYAAAIATGAVSALLFSDFWHRLWGTT